MMDWITGLFGSMTDALGTLGTVGAIAAFVIVVGQWAFGKETRAAFRELVESITNVFTNIPRRWQSERDRMQVVKQRLLDLGTDKANDALVVKEFSEWGLSTSRVIAGIVEDVLNVVIKAAVFVTPPALAFYRRFILPKKRK